VDSVVARGLSSALVFRRRSHAEEFDRTIGLDDEDRTRAREWWHVAQQRLHTGRGDTSWLTGNIMISMALGYARQIQGSESRRSPTAR
jgi:hypothetical protein